MNPPKLAQRDSIRIFSINDQNIAVVTGKKPRNYEVPHLAKEGERRLVIEFPAAAGEAEIGEWDSYIVVQPVRVTAKLGAIEVWHSDGCDHVEIAALCAHDSSAQAGLLGISQDFSLESAIKDALSRLTPEAQRQPQLFDVVSMGALYGGFSGFSRLFVKMSPADFQEAESLAGIRKSARKTASHRLRCQASKP